MELFDSLNGYQSLEVLTARSPQELVNMIKKFTTPINVMSFTCDGRRHYAYIMGDVRIKRKRKQKENINGNSNSSSP